MIKKGLLLLIILGTLYFPVCVRAATTDDLLQDGKILEAIYQIWVNNVGPIIFPSMILFLLAAVLYINYQSFIPIVFFAALIFVLIRPIIPAEIFGFVLVLIVLGVAIIFYWLFVRERK